MKVKSLIIISIITSVFTINNVYTCPCSKTNKDTTKPFFEEDNPEPESTEESTTDTAGTE